MASHTSSSRACWARTCGTPSAASRSTIAGASSRSTPTDASDPVTVGTDPGPGPGPAGQVTHGACGDRSRHWEAMLTYALLNRRRSLVIACLGIVAILVAALVFTGAFRGFGRMELAAAGVLGIEGSPKAGAETAGTGSSPGEREEVGPRRGSARRRPGPRGRR